MSRRTAGLAAVLVLALLPIRLPAQGVEYVKANYTKYEFRIPMRDGVKLFTAVYVPKDTSRPYPILLQRTPYSVGPYGLSRVKGDLGPSPRFGAEGYIFAYQDVRGRWMSEGEFVNMRPHRAARGGPTEIDESTDTYDTIEWLIQNVPGNSGKVGQWGISYPGFYTDCGILSGHPALVAASPQAPVTDWFVGDDFHHNGALFLPHLFNFIANFGKPRPEPTTKFGYLPFDHGTPDGYAFFLDMGPLKNADQRYFKGQVAFWNEVMAHPDYDAFWQERNIRQHLRGIKPAVMTVGGWFDAENLFGALETYRAIERTTPGATNLLVMGPWSHGGWSRGEGESLGHVHFGQKTAEFYREQIEFPFFQKHLKGDAQAAELPEAFVFETGRNQWHRLDAWPPPRASRAALYLRDGGQLAFDPPAEDDPAAFDEYTSDPAKPVPFIDHIAIGMTVEYMVGDQRFAGRRPDVLVYQTPPLERDTTIAGPIRATLFVSTSGTDSDWIVKLIDVYPDDEPDPNPNPSGVRMGGFQQLVRGEVMRGKYRESYESPSAFEANRPTPVGLTLQDVFHTFRAGHRIMVQVQSTWFPLVDRNPQQFENIYQAKASDFQKAIQRVYRGKAMPSRLEVLLLPDARPEPRAAVR
jgi:putative CocE/NonD family hydrolase